MYSVASYHTFEQVKKILGSYYADDTSQSVVLLVGNKSGEEESREVTDEEAREYAEQHGFLFKEISVKNSLGIDDIFHVILEKLVGEGDSRAPSPKSKGSSVVELPSLACSVATKKVDIKQVEIRSQKHVDFKTNSLLLSNVSYSSRVQDPEARRIISDVSFFRIFLGGLKPEIQTKMKKNQKVGNPNKKTVFVWIVDLKLSNLGNPNKNIGNPNKKY
jgi:hypothetical protein